MQRCRVPVPDRVTAVAGLVWVLAVGLHLPVLMRPLELKYDQAQVLYLAWEGWQQGRLPQHGVLNGQIAYNPPFFVWLYMLPMMFRPRLRLVLTLPALLVHALALFCLFDLGRRMGYRWGGVAAMAVYGFTFRGLYFGHASWATGVNPAFFVLFLYAIYRWAAEGHRRFLLLSFLLLSWMIGVHWGGWIALGLLAAVLVWHRHCLRPAPIVWGLILAAIPWAPYLQFEARRQFRDMRAVVGPNAPAPKPGEISEFCRAAMEPPAPRQTPHYLGPSGKGWLGKWRRSLWLRFPRWYESFRSAYILLRDRWHALEWGVMHALHTNFRPTMDPRQMLRGWPVRGVFLGLVLWFVLALAHTVQRAGTAGSAMPDRFLVAGFAAPVLFQSLTPYTPLQRPDITWLVFGAQALVMGIAVERVWIRLRRRRMRWTLLLMVALVLGWPLIHRLGPRLAIPEGPSDQFRVVAWIASGAQEQGRYRIRVRYDFLYRHEDACWLVSYAGVDPHYRIGAEFNFLLQYQYGVENVSPALDGLDPAPDYIVVRSEDVDDLYPDVPPDAGVTLGAYTVLDGARIRRSRGAS